MLQHPLWNGMETMAVSAHLQIGQLLQTKIFCNSKPWHSVGNGRKEKAAQAQKMQKAATQFVKSKTNYLCPVFVLKPEQLLCGVAGSADEWGRRPERAKKT